MASYFIRKGSAFYYLKVKRGRRWVMEATDIRHEGDGAVRKILKRVNEEERIELADAAVKTDWAWVSDFLWTSYGGKEKTLLRYAAAWTAVEVYLAQRGIKEPREVTYQLCRDYPQWRLTVDKKLMRPCVWNTALTELRVFSAVLQEAVRTGKIPANPCVRLGFKRRNTKVKPEITLEQQATIEAALADAPEWMLASWTVAMAQGFRLMETAVPLSQIDPTPRPKLPLGIVWVLGKGDRTHTAPLHPAVHALYLRAKKAGRTRLVEMPKSPAKEWWKFFRKLGLPGVSFHSTKVSVVTRLARAGVSKQRTMAYVGHASETVNAVYTRLGAPDVASLSRNLPVGAKAKGKNPRAARAR